VELKRSKRSNDKQQKRKFFSIVTIYTFLFIFTLSMTAYADGPVSKASSNFLGEIQAAFVIVCAGVAIWAAIQRKFTILLVDIVVFIIAGMFVFDGKAVLSGLADWLKGVIGY
jgi:hypothetical protein